MLTESQLDRVELVLVSPRNPLNIGAAARAMANFGFSRLTVVAPYEPHWREAKSAIGAEKLLQKARCTQSLAEAVAGCSLVLGTATPTRRKPEQPVLSLPGLAPILEDELARGGRIAVVFGPEKRGLTRNDLSLCHWLVVIPTHPRQPSMNLAQAVAVCLYELIAPRCELVRSGDNSASSAALGPSCKPEADTNGPDAMPPATARDLDLLASVIDQTLAASNYSPSAMRNANRHDLDVLLRRLALGRRDVRRILGAFRRILWQLERRGRD
ncbi:MAG: RNA methyltransferase [Terracidiphilus sp.]